MTKLAKKEKELECAEFFIDRLNEQYNFDYRTKPNKNENKTDEFIDVYAVSKSGDFTTLNLQVTTREGKLFREFAKLHAISEQIGKNVVMGNAQNISSEEWIIFAVKKKENHYSSSVKRNLILLVSAKFGPLFNKSYLKRVFSDLKSEFYGIYSVHLPSTPKTSSHPHDGQVIAIKELHNKINLC